MSILHGNIPSDEEKEEKEIGRPKKKQKTNSEVVDAVAKKDEEEQKFLQRWFFHDKTRMLKLLKKYGAAMYEYDFDHTDMEFRDDLTDEITNLDGKIYDIIFVAGRRDDHHSCCFDYLDGRMISRTVMDGTLKFFTKQTQGGDVLYGRIDIEKNFCSPGENDDYDYYYDDSDDYDSDDDKSRTWESTFQTHGIEFQFEPDDSDDDSDNGHVLTFDITKHEDDTNCVHFFMAFFYVITNSGVIDWTPTEYEPVNNPITFNNEVLDAEEYKSFMQNQILQRYNGNLGWCPESSWLCNHMQLPHETAQKIHSYLLHELPDPKWMWKKDDVLIRFEMSDGATMEWTTEFIARPRPDGNCTGDEIESDNSDSEDTDSDSSNDSENQSLCDDLSSS